MPRTNEQMGKKLVTRFSTGEVLVLGEFRAERVKEDFVGDLANVHAGFIEHGEDSKVRLLDQVANDLVVEVVHLQRKRASERVSESADGRLLILFIDGWMDG